MKPVAEVTACVVDNGWFPHIAQCLAAQMKKVFYCGPARTAMPRIADAVVGDGFEGMERVTDLWSVKDQCGLFVFPDIGFYGEQRELISQGLPVWGHHGADELETDKGLFLSTLKDLGMNVPPHQVIRGLTHLRDYLRDQEDLYIKVSRWRGDWETFHWRNWTMDESALDCAAYRFGPVKDLILFYVFEPIDTEIEDGVDTWCVNGQWPKRVLHAMERKDKSLLGAMQDFADVAEPVRAVNEAIGPVLEKYGYAGAFSTEVRLNDRAWFIDPTCRFGSPPSQLQTVLITNLPDVIWRGANGEVVEPESPEEIGAQVLITTDREKKEWATVELPEELRPWVKSAFSCQIDSVLRIAPNPLENWAGWLVATGNTIAAVIETLKERKTMLPQGFDCDLTSLCELLAELEVAEKKGVEITDQLIPEPETVLEP